MRTPLEPDVVSSDSTNSVREQLRQVNQRLDEVQRDFVRSKEEVRETTKGGSPFAPEILDKPIPFSFRLPTLEPYDGSTDPTEHVTTYRAQMALYDTFDALMCRTFPTILREPARMWYSRIKPNPSIPDATSALAILLIIDRETLVHGARDVTTGEPICSHRKIDVIVDGPASGRDSSSARKAYAWSAIEKRPKSSQDPEITFGDGDNAYPDHDDALVISAQIANARVKQIMMDTGMYLARLNLCYGPEATSVRGHPLDSRSASVRPLWGEEGAERMIWYPMGRSDSSKPAPDGQPQQHFGGSHVGPRDQVDS
ncbi:hypothetical protein BHM03_00059997 [Ensete ventricosum]|nr:hypothetical protein BHM03_00059997 [Ensete ventricosum]